MKKPPLGGSGQEAESDLTIPATEAEQFLRLLGKDPAETWFRTLKPVPGKGVLPNVSRRGADLHGFDAAALEADNQSGSSIYLITGDAEQATGKPSNVRDADVTCCRAVFVEWDDRPIEWQVNAWKELGLPEPTAMVTTGGKSIHCYYVLSEPMAPDEWRVLQRRLIDYAGGDKNCKNPSRLMRLPGYRYVDKGTGEVTDNVAELIHQSDATYTVAEIEACLPAPQPVTPPSPAPLLQPLAPREVQEIRDAVAVLPPRSPQTYEQFRNALCGCSAALSEAGVGDPDGEAIRLMADLWEHGERQARQVLESTTTRNSASFWAIAREYGFSLKRSAPPTPVTAPQASQQQEKPPASLDALIDRLPDGWNEKHTARPLSPGHLAEMLPAQNFRYNELDLRAYVETSSGWKRITDDGLDSAYVLLTGKGWKIGAEPVVKAILHVARQNSIHPVREYLQRVKADPSITPYDLDQVAQKLFRASQPLHAAMVRKWLIGAAARALKPGCQMDYCLVLKGDQGLLKSTSLKALTGGEWFTSTHADGDKDFLLNVHSCWVYELAELEFITNTKQAGALKNLITTATDVFRPPYGRTPERTDRQSVFCATVNKDRFLRDDTGNRRFWVVPIAGSAQLDRDAITAARDAIWKAAVLAHEAGELPMLSKELEALSAAQNEQFNEQDAWVGMVQAWMTGDPLHRWDPDRDPSTTKFDPAGAFTSAEILYSAGLKRPDAITRADEMRLGEVLKGLGFLSRQRRVNGKPARLWGPSQPVPTVTTSTAEVVTHQNLSSAAGQELPSQPSQPQNKKGETRGQGGGTAPTAVCESNFGKVGCDTPREYAKAAVVQPISASQPGIFEVVTSTEVVTPAEHLQAGTQVEYIDAEHKWHVGFTVADRVETSTGIRYRIESDGDFRIVPADKIRLRTNAA